MEDDYAKKDGIISDYMDESDALDSLLDGEIDLNDYCQVIISDKAPQSEYWGDIFYSCDIDSIFSADTNTKSDNITDKNLPLTTATDTNLNLPPASNSKKISVNTIEDLPVVKKLINSNECFDINISKSLLDTKEYSDLLNHIEKNNYKMQNDSNPNDLQSTSAFDTDLNLPSTSNTPPLISSAKNRRKQNFDNVRSFENEISPNMTKMNYTERKEHLKLKVIKVNQIRDDLSCLECGFIAKSLAGLKNHRHYTCDKCKKVFTNRKLRDYTTHIGRCGEPYIPPSPDNKCIVCDKTFSTKGSLKRHMISKSHFVNK